MVLANLQFCCPDDYAEIPNVIFVLDQECLYQIQLFISDKHTEVLTQDMYFFHHCIKNTEYKQKLMKPF